jgi:hypothetical protein
MTRRKGIAVLRRVDHGIAARARHERFEWGAVEEEWKRSEQKRRESEA